MSGTIPITSASDFLQQTTPAAGGTIQDQIAQARLLLKNGDCEGAEQVARAGLATDANALELHSILLYSLHAQRKQLELEAAARAAIAATPASSNDRLAVFHHTLSVSLKAQGKIREAEAAVRDAVAADPEGPNLKAKMHGFLADLLHAQDRIAEERVELQAVLVADPTSDNVKQYVQSRITVLDSLDSSTPQQQAARSIQAQGARAFTNQQRRGPSPASLAPPNPSHYTPQSDSASPQQTTPAAGGTIQDRIAEAQLLLKNSDYKGAALELHSILHRSLPAQGRALEREAAARAATAVTPISSNETLAESHLDLSISLRTLGKIPEAEAAAREAMKADPADPNLKARIHALLAILLRERRSAEELDELRAAPHAGPIDDWLKRALQSRITELGSSSTPQQQAARSIQAQGAHASTDQQESASAPADLVPLNSRHYTPQSDSASPQQTTPAAGGTIRHEITRAKLLLENGDYKRAERVARVGLVMDANALELHSILLQSLHAQSASSHAPGKQLELEAAAQVAIAATPASSNDKLAEIHLLLASSLQAQGRIPEAEAAARKATKADPADPNLKALIHYQLAVLLRLQSKFFLERVELRAALVAGPTDDRLKRRLQSRITEMNSSSTPQQQAARSIQALRANAFTNQQGRVPSPASSAPPNPHRYTPQSGSAMAAASFSEWAAAADRTRAFTNQQRKVPSPASLAPPNPNRYTPQSGSAMAAAVVARTPAGEEVTCPMRYADHISEEFRAEMGGLRGELDALRGRVAELESQTNSSVSSSAGPPAAQAAASARRGSKRRPDAAPSAANPPADKRNKAASEED